MATRDLDPLVRQVVRALQASPPQPQDDFEARARYGQLVFSAQILAERTRCDCQSCQLLRRAVDLQLSLPQSQEANVGSSDRPPA